MRLKRAMLYVLFLALIVNTVGIGGTAAYAADEISSLVLNKNELSMDVGSTASLTATAVYVSGATESVTVKTEWNSGSPDVASVYAGTVTAKKEGTAVITATYMGKTVIVNVTVAKKVKSLVKDKQTLDLRKGEAEQLTITAYYDDGESEDVTKKVNWNIDDGSVATVINGLVTGQSSGSAVITASLGSQSVSIPVNVEIVKRVDLEKKELSLLLNGSESVKLYATYPDGQVVDVSELAEWESEDPDIADVIKGKITGYGAGQTEIYAVYGTKYASISVDVDKAIRLSLDQSDLFLHKDDSNQVTLTATYADGTTENITSRAEWLSSDDSIVAVTKGKITAISIGEATITAKYGDKQVSLDIDVDVPRLLIVDKENLYLQAGKTTALTLTATYADGSTKDVTKEAKWTVSNSSIAYATKGTIITYKAGSAVVTAKYGDKSVKVNVDVDVPKSIALSQKTVNFQIGDSEVLVLTAVFSDGREENVTETAEWTTSDSSIADVSSGVVTGTGTGVASITAEYGTRKVTATISVGVLKSLSTDDETELALSKGAEYSFSVKAVYTDGTGKDVTEEAEWSSSSTKVVKVDESGKATAVASGSAVVTASLGGKQVEFTINVDLADSLTASPTKLAFDLNEVKTISLTAKDISGNSINVADKAEWSSSNTAVATVDKGVVTPVSRGKVTITAKYGGKSVSIQVETGVVESLTTDKKIISTKSGESVQITLYATLSDGTKKEISPESAVWKSSSYKIADVTDGLVTGVAAGTAKITATFGGKSVTVSVDVDSLKYLQTDYITVEIKAGASLKVTATATYSDLTEEDVSIAGLWSTSNKKVADVKDGVIRAIGKGKATITVTYGKKKTQVYVTVVN